MAQSRSGAWAGLTGVLAVALAVPSPTAAILLALTILAAARMRAGPQAGGEAGRAAALGAIDGLSGRGLPTVCILFAAGAPCGGGPEDRAAASTPDLSLAKLIRSAAPAASLVSVLDGGRIALIAAAAGRRVDLAALACRCQAAVEDAAGDGEGSSLSAGLATGRAGMPAATIFAAAGRALEVAQARGPGELEMVAADEAGGSEALDRIHESGPPPRLEAWMEPRISTRTGAVSALSPVPRWRHPVLGLLDAEDVRPRPLYPDEAAARTLGLLDEGLAVLRRLEAAGLAVPLLSLDLEAGAAATSGLAARIAFALDREDVAPDRLEVRLRAPVAEAVLAGLSRIGCRIAGAASGGTGLAALRDPVGTTILAAEQVRGIAGSDRLQERCRALIGCGRKTVALAVACPADAACLARLGVGHLQGPAIAAPMRGADLAAFIAAEGRRAPARPPDRAAGR